LDQQIHTVYPDEISLSELNLQHSSLHSAVIQDYAQRTTLPPPILIDGENSWIMDGFHRANAAAQRADATIWAYIGLPEHLNPN